MRPRRSSGKPKPDVSKGRAVAPEARKPFPVVGIGASAGGLEAFTQLLAHLPQKTGMALVFIQHLAPRYESALTELLSRATPIPVAEVKDGMVVEPDRIYVIPPNTNMVILNGRLHLMPRAQAQQHLPINYFLRSLAEELGNRAIGVILSGTASDGALGIKAIKAEGGITFAQDEKSAKYGDMPRNAAATGAVDFILEPAGIARELERIARHPYLRHSPAAEAAELPGEGEEALQKIFFLLRNAAGVDFTHYKHTTIKRRINRRMVLHKMQDLKDYVQYLRENRAELEALYQDILIHVTGFFRDPEAFLALKATVFPSLMKGRRSGAPVRIWAPGCSTGEEVYSIAIALLEFLGSAANATGIQIFATDISDAALAKARMGAYTESITTEVSPERIRRFFVKTTHGYQINKMIREMCVFARQDIIKDPPFSRLDLISCRNLLIYLGSNLQKKVLPIFHYALKPSGFLLLGSSETIGAFADHFSLVDKKHKIYAKKHMALRPPTNFTLGAHGAERPPASKRIEEARSGFDVQKEADHILLARFAPAGVVVNQDLEILQFRGHTGAYLEPAPGQASLSLSKMVREGLLVDLRAAVQKAKRDDLPVKKQGVSVKSDGRFRDVDLEVIPIPGAPPEEPSFLVLFQEAAPPAAPGPPKSLMKGARANRVKAKAEERQVAQLKHELAHTKSELQSLIEEQDTINEELKSVNEESLSSNEELQSTNEELETAKEELQSTNEELTTLNEELQNRNLELGLANNDLLNLLASVNIPILMLGNDLRIRRFTPMAEKLLNLIPTDIGRPIGDIKPNFNVTHLDELITEAIDTVTIKEMEVKDRQDRWYSMRIRPYKTAENRLEGAVITWVDITTLKASLDYAAAYAQAIVETARESLLVLDKHFHVKTANQTFYRAFQVAPGETENRLIYELGNGQWNIPRLRTLLEELLPQHTSFEDFEVNQEFPHIGCRDMLLNARQIEQGGVTLILLAIEDVTDRKRSEASVRETETRLREIAENVQEVFFVRDLREDQFLHVLYTNPAYEKVWGRSIESLDREPASWFEAVHPEDRPRLAEALQTQRTGREDNLEYRILRPDGSLRWIRSVFFPVRGDKGEVLRSVGVAQDITELKRAGASLRELSTRVFTIQDEERQRIARDLHDTTAASLVALAMNLSIASRSAEALDPEARAALAQCLALAKKCSSEIRTVSYLLHPPLMHELGLAAALRWYVEGFAERSNVHVEMDLAPGLDELPRNIEMTLFRVVQESLSNVHRHSGSSSAKIRIARGSGEIMVEISDEGRGMPPEVLEDNGRISAGAGLGLRGMEERVRETGGRLEVHSEENGTTLRATLPLTE
ncbi:MAG: chemotaxis protein CheB [Terriglobia bacterium]